MSHPSSNQFNQNVSGDTQWNQVPSDNQWNQVSSDVRQPNETISRCNYHNAPANYCPGPSTNAYGSTNDTSLKNINGHQAQQINNVYNSNGVWSGVVANGDSVTAGTNGQSKNGTQKKCKRVRTAFTSTQMMYLEAEFKQCQYLERGRRLQLAQMLGLKERTIKVWFQNRRMKAKKDLTESWEVEATSTTEIGPTTVPQQQFADQQLYIGSSHLNISQQPQSFYAEPLAGVVGISAQQGPSTSMLLDPRDITDITSDNSKHLPNLDINLDEINIPMQQSITNGSNEDCNLEEGTIDDVMQLEKIENGNASGSNSSSWDMSWIRSGQFDDWPI